MTGLPLLITGPVNTQEGEDCGFEGQIRTFFDFDFLPTWARSFGIEANASYIDATAQYTLFCSPTITQPACAAPLGRMRHTHLPIPDVSKWNFNVTGMYERGPFSARLSYSWRGRYPEGPLGERDGIYTLQGRARPSPRLDFSSSYTVNDNLTLFLDWTNIFRGRSSPTSSGSITPAGAAESTVIFPMVVRFEETILSGGVRFKFGSEGHRAPPPPPPVVAPPPPPPQPVIEQPAPLPPPPPPRRPNGAIDRAG